MGIMVSSRLGHPRTGRKGSDTKRRLASLAALSALSATFFISGAEAKTTAALQEDTAVLQEDPTQDPRCTQDPLLVDAQSETTINPLGGMRIVLTRAVCAVDPASSETTIEEPSASSERDQIVVVVESGSKRFIAFVGRFIRDQASTGRTTTKTTTERRRKDIRQMELHLPVAGDRVCVEFNENEVCVPPR